MKIKNKSALALILSVGIVAILTLIIVGFSAFTRLELQATENQTNLLKASFIAQAGIAKAIEDIKYHPNYGAINESYDSIDDPWYYPGNANYDGASVDLVTAAMPSYSGDVSYANGSYRLKVIDCGGLININCALPNIDAETDLQNILIELGLTFEQARDLVAFRQTLPGGVFTTKEEIKLVPVVPVGSRISHSTYESIKDFITLWGDDDDGIISLDKTLESPVAGHTRKSFVNINTAPVEVLRAVFRLMMNNDSEADDFADAIKARRATNPFDGQDPDTDVFNFLSARGEFERYIEYAYLVGIITAVDDRNAVLAQSDPNIYATNSTKIGFDANGYYEIEAIGTYRGAKKRIKQVVSVFRKINQTTKDEFSTNASLAATRRISWKDTCPVDFTVLKQFAYPDDTTDTPNQNDYIENSLKLGFWDNFQEDYDPANPNPVAGILGPWQTVNETFTINDGGDGLLRTWVAGAIISGQDYFPKVDLDKDVCIVDDFAMIVHGKDENNSNNAKYPVDRPNLPWPAIPLEWSWIFAPAPTALNCPDIGTKKVKDAAGNDILDADGNPILVDVQYVLDHMKSWGIHEQYLNTFHVRFGNIIDPTTGIERMSAIFCNASQTTDLLTDSISVYQNWVDYDGSGYIYFTPSPNHVWPDWQAAFQTCMKPYSVISGSNVMVSCNEWYQDAENIAVIIFADDSVEYFLIDGNVYQDEKTFHLIGIGELHTRGEVYFKTAATKPFVTTHNIMVWKDRFFQFTGMGNFPDVDYFRVVPGQGVYTSNMFSPAAGMGSGQFLEWGTISAHITLPASADSVREPVYLAVADSAILIVPDPADVPASPILASGGAIGATTSQSICYQAYLFSDKDETVINNTDFEQAPVAEDVTITYLPKTQIVYQNAL